MAADLPHSEWERIGTATDSKGYRHFIWQAVDAQGLVYRVTNNPLAPWSEWGVRDLAGLLKRSNLTREN